MRDVIIRNRKITFRNSTKLLEPEESVQKKVIHFPDTVQGSENRAPEVGRKNIRSLLATHTYGRPRTNDHDTHGAHLFPSPEARVTSGRARRHASSPEPSLPVATVEVPPRHLKHYARKGKSKLP